MRQSLEIEGRALSLSNLDKVLYPATGFRKRDLLAYYRAVAPVLLPHLADRALQLGRWPDGVEYEGELPASLRELAPEKEQAPRTRRASEVGAAMSERVVSLDAARRADMALL